MQQAVLNDRRTTRAWTMFDWANSSYSLVIVATIFPAYYGAVTSDQLELGRWTVSNSALLAFAISGAYLVLAAFSPILSGIADYSGRKKIFMKFFTTIGALACISLYFFTGTEEGSSVVGNFGQISLGIGAYMLATVGYSGAIVFYNAYLPEIATEDRYDRLSARGYALGYIGSVILLVINLVMISNPQWFGLPEGDLPVRIAFITVGLWWLGFALIPFRRLPADRRGKVPLHLLSRGIKELKKVWALVKHQNNTLRFLASFFFYSAGVQTVLFLAATFAEKELSFASDELIGLILILQFVGIGGAYLFAFLSEKLGNKWSITSMLLIWMAICVLAYLVHSKLHFYGIAAAVGLVMGGIQSMSRSTYSKLLPEETTDTTSFFSFYDILEKVAIVFGTMIFGVIEQLTGGMRNSILALIVFFAIALVLMRRVRVAA